MTKVVDERGDLRSKQDDTRDVKLTAVEARQGVLGRPVLKVLIGGLVLAALAWGAAEIFGERVDNDAATGVQQTAPGNGATPLNPPTTDNTPSNGETLQPAPVDKDPTPQTGTTGG